MQFKISSFEVKRIGGEDWQEVSEKSALEKLATSYDPVTPVITKMLAGIEVITETEIYRMKS